MFSVCVVLRIYVVRSCAAARGNRDICSVVLLGPTTLSFLRCRAVRAAGG